jgi:hypothetical protein
LTDGKSKPYPREVRERTVRMVLEHGHEHESQSATQPRQLGVLEPLAELTSSGSFLVGARVAVRLGAPGTAR